MATSWIELKMDKGAVITRQPHMLNRGEMQRAAGVRYKQGDPELLYRDTAWTQHSDNDAYYPNADDLNGPPDFLDIERLSFEDGDNFLLALGKRPGDYLGLFINVASNTTNSTWLHKDLDWLPMDNEYLGLAHYGDQYFLGVGTDYNWMIHKKQQEFSNWPVQFTRMGMLSTADAGFETTAERYGTELGRWGPASFDGEDVTQRWGHLFSTGDGPAMASEATGNRLFTQEILANQDAMVYWVCEYDAEFDVESPPYWMGMVMFDQDPDNAYWGGANPLMPYVEDGLTVIMPSKRTVTYQSRHWVNGVLQVDDDGNPEIVEFEKEVGTRVKFDFTGHWDDRINERATHFRIYRTYLTATAEYEGGPTFYFRDSEGNLRTAWKLIKILNEYDKMLFAAKGDDLFPEPTDSFSDPANPGGPQWEYHYQAGGTFLRQNPPKPFRHAVSIGQQLLVDSPTEGYNVLRYSLDGFPEYFPDSNILGLDTEDSDRITGLTKLGTRGIIMTKSGVHKVNFLPGPNDVQDPLETVCSVGCPSDHGFQTISMPQGQVLIWLSYDGLYMSTGSGASNACQDWSIEAAGLTDVDLSRCVMIDNQRHRRLELLVPDADGNNTVAHHFYYAREHLKPSGLKYLGPHVTPEDLPVRAATNERSDTQTTPVWYAAPAAIYSGNQDLTSSPSNVIALPPIDISTGLMDVGPTGRLTLHEMALRHTLYVAEDFEPVKMRTLVRTHGRPEWREKDTSLPLDSKQEYDRMHIKGISGNELIPGLYFDGPGPMYFGPWHIELEASSDGS